MRKRILDKKRKVGMIIQARMSSTRLPGKTLKKILGKPMIFRILERVKRCQKLDKIIVAIPKSKKDDILYDYLKSLKVNVFRGSENNLIKRFYMTAKKFNLKYIVRLPADNPLPDWNEIDRLIKFHLRKKDLNLFSSNLQPLGRSKYIDGIGAEMFNIQMLEKLIKNPKLQKNKEHLTLNFFNIKNNKSVNSEHFNVGYPKSPKSIAYPKLVLDVNFKKQYTLIKKIYEHLYVKNEKFNTKDVIKFLKKTKYKFT